MKIQIIIIGLAIAAANLFSADCGGNFLSGSDLPKEMPEKVEFGYNANGGMARAFNRISVADNILTVETLKPADREPKKWSAEITAADKAKVYAVFVTGEFDSIKNDKANGTTYDAPSASVSLTVDGKNYRVEYGANAPLSGASLRRYQAVADAIKDLAARYETKVGAAATVADNYAVIEYDSQNREYDFKNARPTTLGTDEIAEVEDLLKKAVDEHNARQKSADAKISLAEYKRQFVPFISETGEKEVWINCFCHNSGRDWRKYLVIVEDGGKCFFHLRVNLTAKKYYNLNVNGEA